MRHRRPSRGPVLPAGLVGFARSSWRFALPILLFLPLLALANHEPRLPSSPTAAPIPLPMPDVAADDWQSRGRVISLESYPDAPLTERDSVLGEAWRAVYTSVSGVDGGMRPVSGAFFVPRGDPPEGGWQIISLAHGTTGIGNDCGPAQQPDLQGYAPIVELLLTENFAVALSDYEGLGEVGLHPYLEARTAAFNTIDAVRALGEISPSVSNRWVALGYSQGGQAVWAANELDSYYGDGLELQGSVALAPAANVTGVADLAWSRSLTEEQRALFPLLVVGLVRYTPELEASSLLHGSAEPGQGALSRCGSAGGRSTTVSKAVLPWKTVVDRVSESNNMRPATSGDTVALRDALQRVALPQRPLDSPMLVVTGQRDALVLADWVESAVADSCALGGRIEYLAVPDADHAAILWKSSKTVMQWIADRFAGMSAPSNCSARPR